MRSRRSTDEVCFQCEECGTSVLPISYRARCPECSGPLRQRPPNLAD